MTGLSRKEHVEPNFLFQNVVWIAEIACTARTRVTANWHAGTFFFRIEEWAPALTHSLFMNDRDRNHHGV